MLSACFASSAVNPLAAIAQEFSPRYERHRDDLVSIDVSGLERLLGPARTIGEELRRDAAARGVHAHVAVASTRMAAVLLAIARPGLTIVAPGDEAGAVAPLPLALLEKIPEDQSLVGADRCVRPGPTHRSAPTTVSAISAFKRWGLHTLGELAALPAADLTARLGRGSVMWQAIARGEDIRPLIPTLAEERFESSIGLEWPIDGLDPLSFILTRLLEPLSLRLERRDRGAAVLHVLLGLVTRGPSGSERETYARRLQLPSPLRDVRTLRTLALLDLESHPPAAAIDRVTIVIDPTPGRVLQHALFVRAHPTPEQLSTLLARLGALMGQDRLGAPATVDSYRPGAFAMKAFATLREPQGRPEQRRGATEHDKTVERKAHKAREENSSQSFAGSASFAFDRREPSRLRSPVLPASYGEARQSAEAATAAAMSHQPLTSALRRCRQPVPARVAVAVDRPARVTTDRRGFAGGTVVRCAGPWRTSGNWWNTSKSEVRSQKPEDDACRQTSDFTLHTSGSGAWDRDEWDVALSDGAVYRIFQDHATGAWFIDAIVD